MTESQRTGADHAPQGTIIALSRDLFFGMRIRTIVRQLGYDLNLPGDEAGVVVALNDMPAARLLLVDFNQPVDWDTLRPAIASDVPVIGFGSHTDVDGFRAARAAGVDRVVSNGEFSRALPDLVAKYARPA